MYTKGLVSTPAPHNSISATKPRPAPSSNTKKVISPYPTDPTPVSGTFTTTPMEQLDYTISQIAPGLGVDNNQPPVGTPPPHKSTPTTTASPVATPSSYTRYESVFKSRFPSTAPLSTLTIKSRDTPPPSSSIFTITSASNLMDSIGSPTPSSIPSVVTSLRPLELNPLTTLSTFSSTPVQSVTSFIKTTALTGRTPSPETAVTVNLTADGQGQSPLQATQDGAVPRSNLELWQEKQRAKRQGGVFDGEATPLLHNAEGLSPPTSDADVPPPPPRLTSSSYVNTMSMRGGGAASPRHTSPHAPQKDRTPPPPPRRRRQGEDQRLLSPHNRKKARDDESGGGGSDTENQGELMNTNPGAMTAVSANHHQHRNILLNEQQGIKYCSNAISTAKYRYRLLFFLPMFLFEQFRRYANIFFLVIALLQQIPGVSPTGRYTTLVPLICILVVSAIKEIAEDIKRHKADDEINNRQVEVLKEGHWRWKKWRKIKVGDIVKIHNNSFFPADLILLASSEPQALCYVETANLDGETNLKIRQGITQTSQRLEAKDLMELKGTLECELPNRFLYQFTGNLRETGKQAAPLSPDQVLLRGAKLQNTNWVFGCVIYTGHETKLMKNSAASAPLKRSTVDRLTNQLIMLLFLLLIVLCLIMAVCNSQWNAVSHWYLALDELSAFSFGINFITFIILFNNLIPISLQVTLELVRYIQAGFINNDIDMYDEEGDVWAMARTSNLNEELGMVKYVLSDKTGTLTCNIMEFKRCTVAGTVYSIDDGTAAELAAISEGSSSSAQTVRQYLTMMAICHTVIPDHDEQTGAVIYHAASPDERALVKGAKDLGFVFSTRTPDYVIVEALGRKETFHILHVLEFTSTRKRMSVIVRMPDDTIKLYCKGADNVIYERLVPGSQFKDSTIRHLEEFAAEGLRTLCFAVADISHEFYDDWKNTFYEASTALQNREKKLEEAALLIEQNLTLLGASAIEDKLQDQVPETIAALLQAGIHVWVLTGDKQETAINIGHSCRLLNQSMSMVILNTETLDQTREQLTLRLNELKTPPVRENDTALIIDGKTLIYALTPDLRKDFLDLCVECKSVICCRVSPSQKAEIVELVNSGRKAVTLAIGDGANDVAMIQKASVGVGIAGQEGLQAACAADYTIGQFRFLARLLLVHGAWNYSRLCKVILYSFYKNICLYVIELWWAILSGWSGQVMFERWTIAMYNVLFTAAPPVAIGIFDRCCSASTRMKYPELYKESQSCSQYNMKVFIWWVFKALAHSAILFALTVFSMTQDVAWGNGKTGGYLMAGNMVYTYVVVTVCLKGGLESSAWTWPTHLAIWGSIGSWFLFLFVYSNFWPVLPIGSNMSGVYIQVYTSPVFWFGLLLIPLTALLLDFCAKILSNSVSKTLTETVRESEISNKDLGKVLDHRNRLTETARLLKNVFRRTNTRVPMDIELPHGFAFSQEEHGVIRQSEVIRAYDTTQPKPVGM